MKTTPFLLLALASIVGYGCARAVAQVEVKPSTADPTRGPIELVVYSGNFAMVRETRKVDLTAGTARIGLQGISKSMDQSSVLFNWPGTKDATVLSSTYDMGMNSSGHLLARFRGKEIELVYYSQDGKPGERVKGTLEVAEPGNIVVKADGRYIVNPTATIEAPTDSGIVTIPQLSAEVKSKSGGPTELAVSYMTGGISWGADYTVTLVPGTDQMNLECWASVTNKTGTDFPDAKISFVAGSPNLYERLGSYDADIRFGEAAVGGVELSGTNGLAVPEAMGELYAYPYKSVATIRQDQMNRVRMMGAETVPVKRVYSIALPSLAREYSTYNGDPNSRLSATMGINFANDKASKLGQPMPAGGVRVYEPDSAGAPRYIGAASIEDTPKHARVNLTLSNVFDVYARGRQTSAKRLNKRQTTRTVELKVTNEKAKPVEVNLVQQFGSGWKVTSESLKSQKMSASMNQWKAKIPANGEVKLRYTVTLGP